MSGLVPRLAENLTRAGRQSSGKANNSRRGGKCLDRSRGWVRISHGYAACTREKSTTLLVGKNGGAIYARGTGHAALSLRALGESQARLWSCSAWPSMASPSPGSSAARGAERICSLKTAHGLRLSIACSKTFPG